MPQLVENLWDGLIKNSPWRPLQLFAVVLIVTLLSQVITVEARLGVTEGTLLTVIFYVIIFLAVFAFLKIEKEGLSSLGFRARGLIMAPLAAVLGFVAQFIWIIFLIVVGGLTFDFGLTPVGTFLVAVLVGAVLVGFVEESVFRGFIQRKLTARYGFARSLILTSFLFMIIHLQFYTLIRLTDPSVMSQLTQLGITEAQVWLLMLFGTIQRVITIFAFGLFLGYVYHKSGQNLVNAALFHMMLNIGGFIVLSYSNVQLLALAMNIWLFVVLAVIWTVVVGALVWATTWTFQKLVKP